VAARKRTTARAAVLPAGRAPFDVARLAPSGRSLAAGVALFALAAGAYAGARETSVFAVRRLEVAGGSPRVRAEVRRALRAELGRSLLRVDGDELERRLGRVPEVLAIRFDRAFPHTLEVTITPERPVLLLRRRDQGWVVSATGRVLRQVRNTRLSSLPRAWVAREASIRVGATLSPADGAVAAAAVAPLAGVRFPDRVRFVRAGAGELTFVLRSRVEIRLGDPGDLRLKLAIARRILRVLAGDTATRYVDVSVPERPVVATFNPQVEG
jgi:cell division protein FtsQ